MADPLELSAIIPQLWENIRASAPNRFDAYIRQGEDKDRLDALARHAWNVSLCQHLQPALHACELTLRNEVHRSLDKEYSDPYWMRREGLLRTEELKRVTEAQDEILARKGLTPDLLVAEMKFGFWVSLFRFDEYESSIVRPVLSRSFRTMPKNLKNREYIFERYESIRRLRNRAFHLERIFDTPDLLQQHRNIWEMVSWANKNYGYLALQHCNFVEVYRNGVAPFRAQMEQAIRRLHKYR